jgi:hypothetical protein
MGSSRRSTTPPRSTSPSCFPRTATALCSTTAPVPAIRVRPIWASKSSHRRPISGCGVAPGRASTLRPSRSCFRIISTTRREGRHEAHSAVKAGLALNPAFAISRARAAWTARSDDPTYLPSLSPFSTACARRGCRKNEASQKAACGSGCDARRLSTGRSIRA